MEGHIYRAMSDEELDKRINDSRANSYVSSSEYHKLIEERTRRKELKRKETEDLIFKNITQRLDNIIKLLEIIGKHPWWAALIGFFVAILTGVFINLLTDIIHKFFPWFIR